MTLSELQRWVAELIAGQADVAAQGLVIYNPANSAAGTGIILDDGNYPKVAGREEALSGTLSGKGVCFLVSEADGQSVEDVSKKGNAWIRVLIRVAIEENPRLNRSPAGTQISVDEWADKIWKRMLGSPSSVPPEYGIEPAGNAFARIGGENGVRRVILDFSIRYHIGPTS